MTLCATLQHDGESSEPFLTGLTGQRLITLHETGHVQHQQNNPSCHPADFLAPAPACIHIAISLLRMMLFLFPGRPFTSPLPPSPFPLPPPLSSSSHVTWSVPGLTRTYLCGRPPPFLPPDPRPQCRPQHCTLFPPTVFIVTTHESNGFRYAHPIQAAFAHESKNKTSNVLLLEPEKPGHRV
jgi:hypothetical protein